MTVIVLHADQPPAAAAPWQSDLLQALPYAKRLELERREVHARQLSLAGIALAVLGAARLRRGDVGIGELSFASERKPTFGHGPWFNVAHSGTCVCCALSQEVDPGIDVETCSDLNDVALSRKLQRWTALEATLKAAGQGLRLARLVELAPDLTRAQLAGVSYRLQPLSLRSDLICTLALPVAMPVIIAAIDLASPDVSATLERSFRLGSQR